MQTITATTSNLLTNKAQIFQKDDIVQFDQFDEDLVPRSKLFSPISYNINFKFGETFGNNQVYDISDTKTNDQQNKSEILIEAINQDRQIKVTKQQIDIMTERLASPNLIYYAPQFIPNMKYFLTQPVPVDKIIQCTFIKNTRCFNTLYPKFELYFSESLKFLCSAQRQTLRKKSYYIISDSNNFSQINNPGYRGKLICNEVSFTLYDEGNDPNKTKELETTRKEYGVFLYKKANISPRSITVLIPSIVNGEQVVFKPISHNEGLLFAKQQREPTVTTLLTRIPILNQTKNIYQLKFNQRVRTESKKNFILILSNVQNDEEFSLQFGKCGETYFNLDICYPLSILQAFTLCIAQFEVQLA